MPAKLLLGMYGIYVLVKLLVVALLGAVIVRKYRNFFNRVIPQRFRKN
ncbi:TPA: hypothetical protein H1008_03235 [archaeon]|nr:hypothetical protein [Candidatus Undinarchaeales archaeon SRR5007147.bin71]